MDNEKLIEMARAAAGNAYAPYSKYAVGAALLCKDGRVFTGCNIECAAFGAGLCAERAALAGAVSAGEREFEAIAVIASGDAFCTPCGICRQMLYEFAPGLRVLCANSRGEYMETTMSELLPHGFSAHSMEAE